MSCPIGVFFSVTVTKQCRKCKALLTFFSRAQQFALLGSPLASYVKNNHWSFFLWHQWNAKTNCCALFYFFDKEARSSCVFSGLQVNRALFFSLSKKACWRLVAIPPGLRSLSENSSFVHCLRAAIRLAFSRNLRSFLPRSSRRACQRGRREVGTSVARLRVGCCPQSQQNLWKVRY